MAALVRHALAEVCTVPVLLVNIVLASRDLAQALTVVNCKYVGIRVRKIQHGLTVGWSTNRLSDRPNCRTVFS